MGHEHIFSAFARNAVNNLKYRSGIERQLRQEISAWRRGLLFTWIWEDRGQKWYDYEQFWFLRGTREYHLIYVPYFWRSREEFKAFEKRFIDEATYAWEHRGRISQEAAKNLFRRRRLEMNLTMLFGPILAAVAAPAAGASAATRIGAQVISAVDDLNDALKCAKGDVESCASLVLDFAYGQAAKVNP